MNERKYNFNAGPAALPLEVLHEAQADFVDFKGIGMSLMEISHRSKEYEHINDETQQLMRDLLGIPAGYQVLFLQGGASTQFAMIPMNFLKQGKVGSYVLTGTWADKAYTEAKLFGDTHVAADAASHQYTAVPDLSEIKIHPEAAYLHMTSNETIGGIQFQQFPDTGAVPLICDMSSDIMSRTIDVSQFSMIYAGAQKNLGPSGVTIAIVSEQMLADTPNGLTTMLRYDTHAKSHSLYNTPPVYSVYIVNLVLKWIQRHGGLQAMEDRNKKKAQLIYDAIDQSEGFYQGVAAGHSRSNMNLCFRLKDQSLESKFGQSAKQDGFVGLQGHRSVGGLRASAYNAVPYEHCQALSQFMNEFRERNQ